MFSHEGFFKRGLSKDLCDLDGRPGAVNDVEKESVLVKTSHFL